ncbi:SDR family NAD(P)-dependent oxidoreductase [Vibrio sp. SCSIO 43135]|uniref:SDR family NAD(P)-dependent oxidoreductase n=1 Tax=Vibrio sp. SCSIO 43135 TaxID=2819096 RepID=UPI0020750F63|nr:SDR family NAD(P)-dependent oxidoreductase [Vibrio sp. SCSIO 43135]USD42847.1 SDR family NAD(P)-dependent oxidoreductase [Vibrio sp. SCSIO 43135]
MRVLIVGASGGIGGAIVRELTSRNGNWVVHATCRNDSCFASNTSVSWHQVDICCEVQVEQLASQVGEVDWIINTVGVLHWDNFSPEKRLKQTSTEQLMESIQTNALPTLLIAKYFEANLKRSASPRLVTISARVGSIEDNRLGGWYSYRASKAALNMIIKTLSIEWGRTLKHASIFAFHPGTTDTDLSKPFQANVPSGKLFTAEYVAQALISVLNQSCKPGEETLNGKFIAYDGSEIPW